MGLQLVKGGQWRGREGEGGREGRLEGGGKPGLGGHVTRKNPILFCPPTLFIHPPPGDRVLGVDYNRDLAIHGLMDSS